MLTKDFKRGQEVLLFADLVTLGVALPKGQVMLLGGVNFHSAPPARVKGSYLGEVKERDIKVQPNVGRLSASVDGVWRIDWLLAGYHPGQGGWRYMRLDDKSMSPLFYAEHAVMVGSSVFVRKVRQPAKESTDV